MYWKVDEYTDEKGRLWYIYNYITFREVKAPRSPYYNGILKEIIYPQNIHMVVKAIIIDPRENVAEVIKRQP
jgi:hypothetical protein